MIHILEELTVNSLNELFQICNLNEHYSAAIVFNSTPRRKVLINDLIQIHKECPIPGVAEIFNNYTREVIRFKNGSYILLIPGECQTRGHRVNAVLYDEGVDAGKITPMICPYFSGHESKHVTEEPNEELDHFLSTFIIR